MDQTQPTPGACLPAREAANGAETAPAAGANRQPGAFSRKEVRIYALCDPDWSVRYVGKTTQLLHDRHKAHIRAAKRGGKLPVHYWLRKRIAAGQPLHIKPLEIVPDGVDWQERERHWIASHRPDGALLNLTNGGEGLSGHRFSQDHKDKIAEQLRTGRHIACEVCAARSWRKANEIAQGNSRFCSRRCSNARHKGRTLFHAA
jgi:hypothetical protein